MRYQVKRRVNRTPSIFALPVTLFVWMGGLGLVCLILIAGVIVGGVYVVAAPFLGAYIIAYYAMIKLVKKYGEGFSSKLSGYYLSNGFTEVMIKKRIRK